MFTSFLEFQFQFQLRPPLVQIQWFQSILQQVYLSQIHFYSYDNSMIGVGEVDTAGLEEVGNER